MDREWRIEINPIFGGRIFGCENILVVSSRQVAENFEKRHDGVLRDIENIVAGLPQNCGDLFLKTTYIHEQNKQEYPEYLMNRDGFTLLAMGFTGSVALQKYATPVSMVF